MPSLKTDKTGCVYDASELYTADTPLSVT